ncbi:MULTISPECIES: preprotein translocase subunit YajC [unclassified Campylobacter]|uniref:preprotein translocase subunit YajC n=1 Tax=unclassified Campylobacter TaxID=2593542 RepID=UPI001BDAE901|nr:MULTISPECIES: preprotein translocase subunit YajC [unclassified Campylobacter]MBZ7975403.1 preprotein translocase subunit YajC [Campylobacter sp. RM12637]MBZ7977236.1 preprotein translocase subunit YajC [Campylobacter sp. RM12654]MBZ7979132.1 preprotein translocase subunit YajC [Campylobacter sp. RM12642]MBZ7981748.1 preprotein translocase subunit YajC [Campylobacter sp. RM12640]MBZ7983142.1 preprotein translocase subunit YajC [Campylobacter sp. RM12647]MBZ7988626.1 preprotein translocase 
MEQNALVQFLPLIVLFAIFYFLIIRPQQKQAKAHKEMLNSLTKGDKIVTNGGLIVEVVKAEDDYLKIRLNDDVVAKLDKNFVARKVENTNNSEATK